MPESSLSPQQVQEKVNQSGLTKEQIKEILDVVLKNKDNSSFGKTISILLANPNETTVGGIIRDLTKAKPDSDLGRVLTVLQALNFDVTLAQLYQYVQTGQNPDQSKTVGFLQSLEAIPILGHLIQVIKLPIVWIAGLFGGSTDSAPVATEDGEKPQSMGFVDDCIGCFVQEIPAEEGQVIDLNKYYTINPNHYTAVEVLDTIGGDTGRVLVKKEDGHDYVVAANDVRHVPIQRFPSLRYVASNKPDVVTLQAYNKATNTYASTMVIKIIPAKTHEISVEAGEIIDLTKYYDFDRAAFTHVKYMDKNAGDTGFSMVTKGGAADGSTQPKSQISLVLPSGQERFIPMERYQTLKYHSRDSEDVITLQAYHQDSKATGPLVFIKINPVLSVDRK